MWMANVGDTIYILPGPVPEQLPKRFYMEAMMLRFTNCKLSYKDQSIPYIKKQVAKELRCNPEELKQFRIEKKSFDARKKPDVYIIYSV